MRIAAVSLKNCGSADVSTLPQRGSCSRKLLGSLRMTSDYFQRLAIPCNEIQPAQAAVAAARMPKICSHIGCA